jgi:hypothetical protein
MNLVVNNKSYKKPLLHQRKINGKPISKHTKRKYIKPVKSKKGVEIDNQKGGVEEIEKMILQHGGESLKSLRNAAKKIFHKIEKRTREMDDMIKTISIHEVRLKSLLSDRIKAVNYLVDRYQQLILYEKQENYVKAMRTNNPPSGGIDFYETELAKVSYQKNKVAQFMEEYEEREKAISEEIEIIKSQINTKKLVKKNNILQAKFKIAIDNFVKFGNKFEKIKIELKNNEIYKNEPDKKYIPKDALAKAKAYYNIFNELKDKINSHTNILQEANHKKERYLDIYNLIIGNQANYIDVNKQYEEQKKNYKAISPILDKIFREYIPNVVSRKLPQLDDASNKIDDLIIQFKIAGGAIEEKIVPAIDFCNTYIKQVKDIQNGIIGDMKKINSEMFKVAPTPKGGELTKKTDELIKATNECQPYLTDVISIMKKIYSLQENTKVGGGLEYPHEQSGGGSNEQIYNIMSLFYEKLKNNQINFVQIGGGGDKEIEVVPPQQLEDEEDEAAEEVEGFQNDNEDLGFNNPEFQEALLAAQEAETAKAAHGPKYFLANDQERQENSNNSLGKLVLRRETNGSKKTLFRNSELNDGNERIGDGPLPPGVYLQPVPVTDYQRVDPYAELSNSLALRKSTLSSQAQPESQSLRQNEHIRTLRRNQPQGVQLNGNEESQVTKNSLSRVLLLNPVKENITQPSHPNQPPSPQKELPKQQLVQRHLPQQPHQQPSSKHQEFHGLRINDPNKPDDESIIERIIDNPASLDIKTIDVKVIDNILQNNTTVSKIFSNYIQLTKDRHYKGILELLIIVETNIKNYLSSNGINKSIKHIPWLEQLLADRNMNQAGGGQKKTKKKLLLTGSKNKYLYKKNKNSKVLKIKNKDQQHGGVNINNNIIKPLDELNEKTIKKYDNIQLNYSDLFILNIIYFSVYKLNETVKSLDRVDDTIKNKIKEVLNNIEGIFNKFNLRPSFNINDSILESPSKQTEDGSNKGQSKTSSTQIIRITPGSPPDQQKDDEYVGLIILTDYTEIIRKILSSSVIQQQSSTSALSSLIPQQQSTTTSLIQQQPTSGVPGTSYSGIFSEGSPTSTVNLEDANMIEIINNIKKLISTNFPSVIELTIQAKSELDTQVAEFKKLGGLFKEMDKIQKNISEIKEKLPKFELQKVDVHIIKEETVSKPEATLSEVLSRPITEQMKKAMAQKVASLKPEMFSNTYKTMASSEPSTYFAGLSTSYLSSIGIGSTTTDPNQKLTSLAATDKQDASGYGSLPGYSGIVSFHGIPGQPFQVRPKRKLNPMDDNDRSLLKKELELNQHINLESQKHFNDFMNNNRLWIQDHPMAAYYLASPMGVTWLSDEKNNFLHSKEGLEMLSEITGIIEDPRISGTSAHGKLVAKKLRETAMNRVEEKAKEGAFTEAGKALLLEKISQTKGQEKK